MKRPFDPCNVYAIGNYVNHGARPDPLPDGYLRDGKYCVTGDGDDSKQTYWHGDNAHDGTDFLMPVGSPVYACMDGEVTGASENDSAGKNISLRTNDLPGSRFYFRYIHLSKMLVETGYPVSAGEIIGLSGDTGWCGVPHLHLSIGTKIFSGNIDPLTHKLFKSWLQGIPYIPREGHTPKHYSPFALNSPMLTINGKFEAQAYNGGEMEYIFDIGDKIIHHVYHPCKFVNSLWRDVVKDDGSKYDLITELGGLGELGNSTYKCTMHHAAAPGIYYFQVKTADGEYTNPVRIKLRDRIIF